VTNEHPLDPTCAEPAATPDIGERVLLLGPGPEWQEATVRSSATNCNKRWLRAEGELGYLFGFELEDGQTWWREIESADWIGGIPHGAKLRATRGSFTLLQMTPDNLAKRQRDRDLALVSAAFQKGVGTWAPDVLRRVAETISGELDGRVFMAEKTDGTLVPLLRPEAIRAGATLPKIGELSHIAMPVKLIEPVFRSDRPATAQGKHGPEERLRDALDPTGADQAAFDRPQKARATVAVLACLGRAYMTDNTDDAMQRELDRYWEAKTAGHLIDADLRETNIDELLDAAGAQW
jgi:hypothetical protein